MKRLGIVAAYLVGVFFAAALIAPWVWHGLQYAARVWGTGFWGSLAGHPFPRILNRCLLVLALAGLVPVARSLGIRSWRQLGLVGRGRALRDWVLGLGLSALMFGAVVGVELAAGLRVLRPGAELEGAPAAVGKAAASGVAVGVIEEVLFRGVLCGGLQPSLGWPGAAVVSSVVYAAVHFLERPGRPREVRWGTGLEAVGAMFSGLMGSGVGSPRFLTLVVAGLLLALAYRRGGTLYLPMGLHAGWVFWIKMRGWLTGAGSQAGGMASEWLWLGSVVSMCLWVWLSKGWLVANRRDGNDPE